MTEGSQPQDGLSPEKQALLALRKMRAKLEAIERSRTEPIAIVGLGCRFPGGASDADSFWRLLYDGVDAISDVPADRFDVDALYDPDPDARGKIYTRSAGFVSGIDRFDAQFFGIARREAVSLDPQQRLLLEVAWEALENAGQAPDKLHGTNTGVFMGISSGDYGQLQMQRGDTSALDLYFGTGSAPSAVACRLSYVLGLVGPSIAVDTACSASLVAVHLACQSLRAGECRAALAGGVNLNLLPEIFINLCLARMLAPDGRSKTFDASADGYARGEGCGVIVLKRLSDAVADGDRILALIRSTAVNQDGRSGGFTAPSELSQEQLLRDAVSRAGIAASDVGYVEAHGTGTPLGDPIEMQALAAVYGQGRSADRPLAVGSVKTNIGHLEAAAGIAGLIKVVLALQHGVVPPHLHLKRLNPLLALDGAHVVVPTEPLEWAPRGRARIAGVSSFGFTGTNAHAILEEAPVAQRVSAPVDRPLHVLTLSGKTQGALADLADRFERHLSQDVSTPIGDVCFTANSGRAHFAHRLAVVGATGEDIRGALAAWRSGDARSGVRASGAIAPSRPEIAFLFTGQGAQYPGMGRHLYDTQPTFKRALDRCTEIVRPLLPEPLLSVMYPGPDAPARLDRTAYTQPALFSLEYALAELWRSWGVEPVAVMGHSLGEYVAACVAGLFSVEDALTLVARRARLMEDLPDGGRMIAVFAGEPDVVAALRPLGEAVAIAAVNGPAACVIAGSADALAEAVARLEDKRIRTERLPVSHAFHSALMDPMLDALERIAGEVTFRTPSIGIVSNLTGGLVDPAALSSPRYWRRHARETVRFAAGLQSMYESGARIFVEIGPSPTLLALGRRIVADDSVAWLPTLRKGRDDWKQILDAVAGLYTSHASVDWSGFDRDYARAKVPLPTYAFQRQVYWLEGAPTSRAVQARPCASMAAADLTYELEWHEAPEAPHDGTANGTWLIFADARGIGTELAGMLRQAGSRAIVVQPGSRYAVLGDDRIEIDPAEPHDYASALNDALAASAASAPLGVIYLWAADAAVKDIDIDTDAAAGSSSANRRCRASGCEGLLRILHALANAPASGARAWVATRGAQPAGPSSVAPSVAQAPVWGFGRVAALEHPAQWGGLVDLEPGEPRAEADALFRELTSGAATGENQVAIRGGRRMVARLVPRPLSEGTAGAFSPDGTYLVTGGLGSLGLKVAGWLVENGARHLLLVGRRGLSDAALSGDVPPDHPEHAQVRAIAQLTARGAEVRVARADVADRSQMRSVMDGLRASSHPLRGVVHAAGVSEPRIIRDLDTAALERVLRSKVSGAWVLHELTKDLPLDCFVLFSSISAVWGSAGLAHYAAANHFLDALAHYRRAAELPGISINWGPWSGGGMATADDQRALAAVGVASLDPALALATLGRALESNRRQVTVARVDWPTLKDVFAAKGRAPLLDLVGPAPAASPAAPAAGDGDLVAQLAAARPADRMALLVAAVREDVATVLGDREAGLPSVHERFFDIGMDSLMAVELRRRLEGRVGRSLPATLAFDHPTAARLSEYLAGLLALETGSAPAAVDAKAAVEPLAMVSEMSEEEIERLFAERVLNPGVGR